MAHEECKYKFDDNSRMGMADSTVVLATNFESLAHNETVKL